MYSLDQLEVIEEGIETLIEGEETSIKIGLIQVSRIELLEETLSITQEFIRMLLITR